VHGRRVSGHTCNVERDVERKRCSEHVSQRDVYGHRLVRDHACGIGTHRAHRLHDKRVVQPRDALVAAWRRKRGACALNGQRRRGRCAQLERGYEPRRARVPQHEMRRTVRARARQHCTKPIEQSALLVWRKRGRKVAQEKCSKVDLCDVVVQRLALHDEVLKQLHLQRSPAKGCVCRAHVAQSWQQSARRISAHGLAEHASKRRDTEASPRALEGMRCRQARHGARHDVDAVGVARNEAKHERCIGVRKQRVVCSTQRGVRQGRLCASVERLRKEARDDSAKQPRDMRMLPRKAEQAQDVSGAGEYGDLVGRAEHAE